MKVLWLCNGPIRKINLKRGKNEDIGWISGAYSAMERYYSDQVEIVISFPENGINCICSGYADGLKYYMFPNHGRKPYRYSKSYELYLKEILNIVRPDIVHIWGTEYSHSLAMTRIFDCRNRAVVNIQGLCSVYAKHFFSGLPVRIVYRSTIRDLLRLDSIYLQMRKYTLRGINECEALRNCNYVIGRTDWDRACVKQINADAKYYHCFETLGDVFYEARWDYEKCEKHSIFVSQTYSTVKGFHFLIQALPEVKKCFGDVKVYVAGNDPFKVPFYRIDSYTKYLKYLIIKNGLRDNIVFLGRLTLEGMLAQYLKANVFVLPSTIENSPNSLGEAMLVGMPVIAANVGGVSCFVRNKINGITYQSDAEYMLAFYIKELFSESDRSIMYAENAHSDAIRIFDKSKNADNLFNIYSNVLRKDN